MRQFPDFLAAYEEYAADRFVPPQFNTWVGLSILAGALERRCWLPWSNTYSFYPNIYVLLVSKPGVGKSVSLAKGVDLLKAVSRKTNTLNIMPSQVTEAKFIELMGHGRSFIDRSAGKEMMVFQNAGYYFASEASNSLRNIFGDFIACLTDFYDCPPFWERATKKDRKTIALKNVCMNILAGSTFDYLGKLVSDENIQGGFASRLLYVVQQENVIREQQWQNGETDEIRALRKTYEQVLIEDLTHISKLTGPMHADPEFGAAWEKWYPEYQRKVFAIESEKIQSVLARANTNVLKVSMLLSAAESDDRILKLRHFERAVSIVEELNSHVPSIFQTAKAAQGPKGGGDSLMNSVLHLVGGMPNATLENVKSLLVMRGFREAEIVSVVQALISTGGLATGAAVAGLGVRLHIKSNPNNNL